MSKINSFRIFRIFLQMDYINSHKVVDVGWLLPIMYYDFPIKFLPGMPVIIPDKMYKALSHNLGQKLAIFSVKNQVMSIVSSTGHPLFGTVASGA